MVVDDAGEGETEGGEEQTDTGEGHAGVGVGVVESVTEEQRRLKTLNPELCYTALLKM